MAAARGVGDVHPQPRPRLPLISHNRNRGESGSGQVVRRDSRSDLPERLVRADRCHHQHLVGRRGDVMAFIRIGQLPKPLTGQQCPRDERADFDPSSFC